MPTDHVPRMNVVQEIQQMLLTLSLQLNCSIFYLEPPHTIETLLNDEHVGLKLNF
jgi:hypothetical protein